MHIRRGRLDAHVFMAQLKDLPGPEPHLDHNDPDIPEHGCCGLQIFSLLIEGKRSFPSLFMQELHTPAEKWTLLDQFFFHCNTKDLSQTGQVAIDRRGTPLQLESLFLEATNHLGRDLIQVFPAKERRQITGATQVGAMGVAPSFYSDRVKKPFCKIPEQRNLLLGQDSCASLGQFCLFDALNAVRDGLVSEVSGGLVSPLFEIEVVVVIRRTRLLVDGHGVLQTVKSCMNSRNRLGVLEREFRHAVGLPWWIP